MDSRRRLQNRMRRFGMMVVALAFVLQTFVLASMPVASLSADGEMVVICTGSGMKTVPLAQFTGAESGQDQAQQPPGEMPSEGTCVLCLLAHTVAIAPSPDFTRTTRPNARSPQAPPVDAPVTSRVWNARQARAPPSNV